VLSDALNAEFAGQPRAMEPVQVGDKQRGLGAMRAQRAPLQPAASDPEKDPGHSFFERNNSAGRGKNGAALDQVARNVEHRWAV